MNNLIYLVPLLPLIGFLINGLGRKHLSKPLIATIGSGTILLSFIISIVLFFDIKATGGKVITAFTFINADAFKIDFSFQLDNLSSLFLLIITGIGFLIHLYSAAYMDEEKPDHYARYFAYLNLFVFSMLLLVMGANYVIMYIGWEGVALCSYLLIGFWFKNDNYNYAANKAFIMNRVGDLGFVLAIFWLLTKTGTVSFNELFTDATLAKLSTTDITAITLLLFIGGASKSAQIPLYTWLPDAMAGPTPISALIHAATMVTAGIYMIARSNILYSMSEVTQHIIAILGIATAFFSATIAIKQNDIKKVLAYSTVSQLGYMFLALGVGAYTGAVFHVMTHAFFKALLFLGAGSVIYALHHEQDIRNMGGLKKKMPITHLTFLLACLAIAGIPPFSGFFSKDEILAVAFAKNPIYWVLGVATSILTAFYMFRLYATTFLGKYRGTDEQAKHIHESPKTMTIPLIILAVFSVIAGFVGVPTVLGGSHQLHQYLSPVLSAEKVFHLEHSTEYMLMGITVALAVIAIFYAINKYSKKPELNEPSGLGKILANKWYVDELYDAIIVKPVLALGSFLKNIIEKSGIDALVNNVGTFVQYAARQLRLVQTGQVAGYIMMMVLAIVVFVLLWFYDASILKLIGKLFY
ncbi:MAG: NADH-quinone oxidoreductase subunit L [Chitinophagaceae bacterium]|nr:NADH-quinone oxidoreductase subunit L [Chitinophagaceae bacterium]MCW5904390.1 NADH-quinone oxidoreductase subunit L [Chitinophagaceae bacterium]